MPTQRTGSKERFRQTLVGRARAMRQHLTAAELKLWDKLRGDQLLGLRFRRQHRVGSYIADFFCHAAKLVVEVDGDSHDERQEYDEKRTYWMSQHKGLRVLRYTNDDVMKHLDAVLENIADWCSNIARPSDSLFPVLRGEGRSEGRDARGVEDRSIRRIASSDQTDDTRRGTPLAPLPNPLPGVPGRGRTRTSREPSPGSSRESK